MDWYNQVPNFNSGNDASSRPLTGSTNDDWVLAGQHSILQGVQPTPAFPSVPSCAPFGQTIGSGDCSTSMLERPLIALMGTNAGPASPGWILLTGSAAPQFSCDYCYEHQGMNGFHRRDHLVQHLQDFHRINALDKLVNDGTVAPLSAATSLAANSVLCEQNAFQQGQPHLFPCTLPGYFNAGLNGYFPKVDLNDHQMMMGFRGFQDQGAQQPQAPVAVQQHQDMDFELDLDF